MKIRQLRYFVAAVEAGTFTKASQLLFVAQSAISKQIAALEADLGVRLLEKGRLGVRPTPNGDLFYTHAWRILDQIARARSELQIVLPNREREPDDPALD